MYFGIFIIDCYKYICKDVLINVRYVFLPLQMTNIIDLLVLLGNIGIKM